MLDHADCPRRHRPLVPALALAAAWAVAAADRSAFAGPPGGGAPASRRQTVVDPAVVPAGFAACRHCGGFSCPPHHGHVDHCRDGNCAPHCPVRPSQNGFYRTEWRRWPDRGAAQRGGVEGATPATPPSSQVPTADEESPRPPADAEPPSVAGDDGAEASAGRAEPRPAERGTAMPSDPLPESPPADAFPDAPRNEAPGPAPADQLRVPPTPPGEPPIDPVPQPRADDAGLFDQSAEPHPGPVGGAGGVALWYPAQVGRSLAAGAAPWQLRPAVRHRAADSARGL